MNREQFEHSIRAAGAVLGVTDLLVIGSQALHASLSGNLPDEASRSVEVNVAVFEDTNARGADLIDGSIGEASMFHALLRLDLVTRNDLSLRLADISGIDERARTLVQARIDRP